MSVQEEEALVRSILPSVNRLAMRFARRNPAMPAEEFIGVGSQEAATCARAYDPTEGVPFEAFAIVRIRWAMGEAAKADNRQSGRRIHSESIQKRLLASPLEFPVESMEDAFAGKARSWEAEATTFLQNEIGAIVFGMLNGEPKPHDEEVHVVHQQQRALRAALEELSPEERWFVDEHYRDDVGLEAIATRLGVSYRTAKRMHQGIKATLAKALAARGLHSPDEVSF